MEPVPSTESPPHRPRPAFTIASWLVVIIGGLITWGLYLFAVAHRRPGEWLPGIGELIIGIGITAVGAFGCGLTALLRRERHRWLSVLPCLAGLATILYYCRNLLR